MRKLFFIFFLFVITGTQSLKAQGIFYGIFSKEKVRNLQNFDQQRWSYGFYLGFNHYDFKIDYNENSKDNYLPVSTNLSFNVGLVGNLRINDYLDLRLEPGVMFTAREFVEYTAGEKVEHKVKSTYVHVPLLLKVSTKRLNNFKPFIIGGVSGSLNLSSNMDNKEAFLRMQDFTYYWEIGFGIDFYLYYFKFTPSIRGVFAINDELVGIDGHPNVGGMYTRAIFLNLTFQ